MIIVVSFGDLLRNFGKSSTITTKGKKYLREMSLNSSKFKRNPQNKNSKMMINSTTRESRARKKWRQFKWPNSPSAVVWCSASTTRRSTLPPIDRLTIHKSEDTTRGGKRSKNENKKNKIMIVERMKEQRRNRNKLNCYLNWKITVTPPHCPIHSFRKVFFIVEPPLPLPSIELPAKTTTSGGDWDHLHPSIDHRRGAPHTILRSVSSSTSSSSSTSVFCPLLGAIHSSWFGLVSTKVEKVWNEIEVTRQSSRPASEEEE